MKDDDPLILGYTSPPPPLAKPKPGPMPKVAMTAAAMGLWGCLALLMFTRGLRPVVEQALPRRVLGWLVALPGVLLGVFSFRLGVLAWLRRPAGKREIAGLLAPTAPWVGVFVMPGTNGFG